MTTDNSKLDRIVILGSGGGGRTIVSIIEAWSFEQNRAQPAVQFLDDADKRQFVNGYPMSGPVSKAFDGTVWPEETGFVIGFGSMHMLARERVFKGLMTIGHHITNVIHPRAFIDRCASFGVGNVIAANCVIHPNARVKNNCFFCVAATIDHDDEIGNNVYLSPGVNLAGGVVLEDNVFVGTNATVLPGVRIGKGATIGAGSVVIKDVAAGITVAGVPSQPIEQKKEGKK